MAEDRSEYFFNFSQPFEIHDDNEVLRRMGLRFMPADAQLLSPEQMAYVPPEILSAGPPPEWPNLPSKAGRQQAQGP